MSTSSIKKFSALWALVLLGLFLLFKTWLPNREALLLTIEVPLLYFTPGFLMTKALFRSGSDQIETVFLSMLFSLILSHLGVYIVEESTKQIFTKDIVLTIALINSLCLLVYLINYKHLSPARLFTRLRSKLHKGD